MSIVDYWIRHEPEKALALYDYEKECFSYDKYLEKDEDGRLTISKESIEHIKSRFPRFTLKKSELKALGLREVEHYTTIKEEERGMFKKENVGVYSTVTFDPFRYMFQKEICEMLKAYSKLGFWAKRRFIKESRKARLEGFRAEHNFLIDAGRAALQEELPGLVEWLEPDAPKESVDDVLRRYKKHDRA
jgi:hypothetical protein